ncbi:nuclear transport factor 2 family protein [Flavobacterium sp. ALD4]|uniref:YybH family protein n=1 Tax=Flavobacterium sp. ALD4 TaxID=2058314 RepID=UPI000C3288D0|nr:nuclear transport factor 2 family protein [Flavobacterium sp. ALD4]PKH66162.1 nuclear transport factor 2 family protein [Flavobacterium sp. ALD4]
MKNRIFKGGLVVVIMSLIVACNQKKEVPAVMVDKEAIKTEIQAMEDAFAEAYNNSNADGINYYAEDAVSFSNGKMPLEGKKAIHESIKNELLTFPKGSKIAFETQEIHASNDGNMLVEIGGYQVKDSTDTKTNSGHFISLFEKKDGKYICTRDMGSSDMPLEKK